MSKLSPIELDFCREFFVPVLERNNSKQKPLMYTTIADGCHLLNELFLINALHIIKLICEYLNWQDVARASELVNFQLLSCLDNPKTLEKIFVRNTLYFRSSFISQLNYNYLKELSPKELHTHYMLISKTPRFQKFEDLYFPCEKLTTSLKYHPFLPVAALVLDNDTIVLIAYDKHSRIRSKCYGSGIICQDTYVWNCKFDKIISIEWSPQGNFLAVFTLSYLSQDRFLPPNEFLQCSGNCRGKKLHLYYFDSHLGSLVKFKPTKKMTYTANMCLWQQSKHIWSDDNVISYYCHETKLIKRLVIDISAKKIFVHVLNIRPDAFFLSQFQKYVYLISHPNHPDKLIFLTICMEPNHYHHKLTIYNLASESIDLVVDIPGVLTVTDLDPYSDDLFVLYSCNNACPFSKTATSNSCSLSTVENVKHLYLASYQSSAKYYTGSPIKTTKHIISINLKTHQTKELLDPRFLYFPFLKKIFLKK